MYVCRNIYKVYILFRLMKCIECRNILSKGRLKYCSDKCKKRRWGRNNYRKRKKLYMSKRHGISLELYTEKTQECSICGFKEWVELHHINSNKKDNDPNNLIGLCPNHHRLAQFGLIKIKNE